MAIAPSRLDTLRNLHLSTLDVAFATAFGTLVGGNFLIGFVQYLGGSEFWIQAVVGLPSLMGLLQIPGAIWGRRYPFYKQFVAPGGWIWRLMYLPFIVLPLLPWPAELRLWILAGCIALATAATHTVGPIYNDWIAELVPAENRGLYFSRRNSISTAVSMGVAFVGGLMLDRFQGHGMAETGFSVLFALGIVCALASMFFYLRMHDTVRENTVSAGLRESLRLMVRPARDKNFQKVIVFTIVFMASATLGGGLYFAFARESLGLTYTDIQLFSLAHAVGTVASAKLWGYLADKFGNKPVLAIVMVGVMLTPMVWLVTVPGQPAYSTFVLTVGHLFNGFVWCGVAVCQMNLYIATSPQEDRANYMGMVIAVQSLTGGLAPFLGAGMMHWLRAHGSVVTAYHSVFITVMVIRVVALLTLLPVKEEGSSGISQTLGQLGRVNPRGLRALRRLSRSTDPSVKAEAIAEVGSAQMPMASGELVQALSDPSPAVRRQAARALGRLVDPEAAVAVTEFVQNNRGLTDEETLEALGDMGAEGAVHIVASFLDDPRSPMRRQAAKTLGRLGSLEALWPLSKAAGDSSDPDLRRAAIQALRTLRAVDAQDVIGRALQDPNHSIRSAAAEAVSELELVGLAGAVRDAMTVYGEANCSELAYALGAVGDTSDISEIIQAARFAESRTTRRRCLLGLARLLGVEQQLYRLFGLQGLTRDQALVSVLKPAMAKSKRLREAVDNFSSGHESKALDALAHTRLVPEISALAGGDVPELFLVAALVYADRA